MFRLYLRVALWIILGGAASFGVASETKLIEAETSLIDNVPSHGRVEGTEASEKRFAFARRHIDDPMNHPTPWIELSRVPSPDGALDAVVFTGSASPKERIDPNSLEEAQKGKPLYPGQTYVRIVPHGEPILNEQPYRFHPQYDMRVESRSVFVAQGADFITVEWLEERSLEIRGKTWCVLKGEASCHTETEASQLIRVHYAVEHNSPNGWRGS